MMYSIDCFVPYLSTGQVTPIIKELKKSASIGNIYLLSTRHEAQEVEGCRVVYIKGFSSAHMVVQISLHAYSRFFLLYTQATDLQLGQLAVERMVDIATSTKAGMVYADHYRLKDGKRSEVPLIDYQEGSLRDDFDFGPLLLFNTAQWRKLALQVPKAYLYAGLYDLRLRLSLQAPLVRINEYLYTETATDRQAGNEKQFDYVDPRNREAQLEMEDACTNHLAAEGALLPPAMKTVEIQNKQFPVKASVIIPVRNRVRTIADAVRSALNQQTDFEYNVIVVDNHSTDGTTECLQSFAAADKRLIHIVPAANDLGIGGCWNTAIDSEHCGLFAVQLDSDDLYKDSSSLQTIVNAFYDQSCVMVIGTYQMTDFDLNPIPPGIIDHREWTPENGHNNALRVNGLGAPRAFFTPLLREIRFPNTSYGEDYAMALRVCREYKIGRVYDVVYLCRRWEDNSDAALDIAKQNAHNLYKDRLRTWELQARKEIKRKMRFKNEVWDNEKKNLFDIPSMIDTQKKGWKLLADNYRQLYNLQKKKLGERKSGLQVQFNPNRVASSLSNTDQTAISARPCFLCEENRPEEQLSLPIKDRYSILINPYPIFSTHLTIAAQAHEPQLIRDRFEDMLEIAELMPNFTLFYNGPRCGASAPDHAHFQAASKKEFPLYTINSYKKVIYWKKDLMVYETTQYASVFMYETTSKEEALTTFHTLYDILCQMQGSDEEPMMNIVTRYENNQWVVIIFLRAKHRPYCYYAQGDRQLLISPGAVDMAGLLISVRREDYDKITNEEAQRILLEVSLPKETVKTIAKELNRKLWSNQQLR